MNSTLYPELPRRVHPVHPERFARRARSLRAVACRVPLGPPCSLASQTSARSFEFAPSSSLSAICPRRFHPSAIIRWLSPLFIAFPYISPVSPLSAALTYLYGGEGGTSRRFHESPVIDLQVALSQRFTNRYFRNSFVFTSIQTRGGATPHPSVFKEPSARLGFSRRSPARQRCGEPLPLN